MGRTRGEAASVHDARVRESSGHLHQEGVSVGGGVCLGLDDHGRITHASASARAVLGARASDLLGRSIADFAVPEDRLSLGAWFEAHRAESTASGILPVEFRIARRHGMQATAVVRALQPIGAGAGSGVQFGVDLIESPCAAPRDSSAQLVALQERIDQLERSNRELEILAATAAHDLKSPLASLGASVEMLLRQAGPALDERSQELVGTVLHRVGQLSQLVDGLLCYSRAGVRLNVESGDGDALVRDVVRELQCELDAVEAMVTVAPLGPVVADLEQLRSVFRNLLTNAVRYRSEDRPLRVWIDVLDSAVARTFTVSDNGPGITSSERERVFRMFERLDSRRSGSGIGLATCQRIVEGHGGRIWLDDAPGGGTAVRFTLPAQWLLEG